MVLEAAEAHCVGEGGLVLEITEKVLMADPIRAGALLQRLRDRGVECSINDFGTGHSSLAHPGRRPVTTLKIDRAFIDRIPEGADALAITASMVDLARTMGMNSVAEGVETVQQTAVLQGLGCNAAQGFLRCTALSAEERLAVSEALPGGHFAVPARQLDEAPRSTLEVHARPRHERARVAATHATAP